MFETEEDKNFLKKAESFKRNRLPQLAEVPAIKKAVELLEGMFSK